MNGSTIDDIGEKDMTVMMNGKLTNDRNGNPNSAICFSKGFASVPPGVYFDQATGGFTFMAWIQVLSYNNWQRIFDFGNGPRNEEVLVAFRERGNKLQLDTYSGGSTVRTGASTSVISLNTWYHVAVSVIGGASSWYVDGVLAGSGTGNVCFVFLNNFSKKKFLRFSWFTKVMFMPEWKELQTTLVKVTLHLTHCLTVAWMILKYSTKD